MTFNDLGGQTSYYRNVEELAFFENALKDLIFDRKVEDNLGNGYAVCLAALKNGYCSCCLVITSLETYHAGHSRKKTRSIFGITPVKLKEKA